MCEKCIRRQRLMSYQLQTEHSYPPVTLFRRAVEEYVKNRHANYLVCDALEWHVLDWFFNHFYMTTSPTKLGRRFLVAYWRRREASRASALPPAVP